MYMNSIFGKSIYRINKVDFSTLFFLFIIQIFLLIYYLSEKIIMKREIQ